MRESMPTTVFEEDQARHDPGQLRATGKRW